MKTSKLLCHVETQNPCWNTCLWSFSKTQMCLLRDTNSQWRPPLQVHRECHSDHIATTKKPFTGEELILLSAQDICHENLGEAAVEMWHMFLWVSAATRQVAEVAEDIEAQLSESMEGGPHWQFSAVGNKATMLIFVWYIFRRVCMSMLLLPGNTTVAVLFKYLNCLLHVRSCVGSFGSVYALSGWLL